MNDNNNISSSNNNNGGGTGGSNNSNKNQQQQQRKVPMRWFMGFLMICIYSIYSSSTSTLIVMNDITHYHNHNHIHAHEQHQQPQKTRRADDHDPVSSTTGVVPVVSSTAAATASSSSSITTVSNIATTKDTIRRSAASNTTTAAGGGLKEEEGLRKVVVAAAASSSSATTTEEKGGGDDEGGETIKEEGEEEEAPVVVPALSPPPPADDAVADVNKTGGKEEEENNNNNNNLIKAYDIENQQQQQQPQKLSSAAQQANVNNTNNSNNNTAVITGTTGGGGESSSSVAAAAAAVVVTTSNNGSSNNNNINETGVVAVVITGNTTTTTTKNATTIPYHHNETLVRMIVNDLDLMPWYPCGKYKCFIPSRSKPSEIGYLVTEDMYDDLLEGYKYGRYLESTYGIPNIILSEPINLPIDSNVTNKIATAINRKSHRMAWSRAGRKLFCQNSKGCNYRHNKLACDEEECQSTSMTIQQVKQVKFDSEQETFFVKCIGLELPRTYMKWEDFHKQHLAVLNATTIDAPAGGDEKPKKKVNGEGWLNLKSSSTQEKNLFFTKFDESIKQLSDLLHKEPVLLHDLQFLVTTQGDIQHLDLDRVAESKYQAAKAVRKRLRNNITDYDLNGQHHHNILQCIKFLDQMKYDILNFGLNNNTKTNNSTMVLDR